MKYQIKCLDQRGIITQTFVVRCKTLDEAASMVRTSEDEAVLIRPLAPVAPKKSRGAVEAPERIVRLKARQN